MGMDSYAFVFTTTQDVDVQYQRAVAISATLIAAALMAFVAFAGSNLLVKYQISAEGLSIAGGLVHPGTVP